MDPPPPRQLRREQAETESATAFEQREPGSWSEVCFEFMAGGKCSFGEKSYRVHIRRLLARRSDAAREAQAVAADERDRGARSVGRERAEARVSCREDGALSRANRQAATRPGKWPSTEEPSGEDQHEDAFVATPRE